MRQVAVNTSFLESHSELGRQEQKTVVDKIRLLAAGEDKHPGFKVHKLERARCDPSFRSARINRDLRVIFSQSGNTLILLYVDHHDEAYRWAEGKYLDVNDFQSLHLRDDSLRELQHEQKRETEKPHGPPPLLGEQGVKQKDLQRLGLGEAQARHLMEIGDEEEFMEFIQPYPEELQEGLLDILDGTRNITQVYADLEEARGEGKEDVEGALENRDTRRRFYVTRDFAEFEQILQEDFEGWRLFLHPQQERLARGNFNGPVLIEGGPGTGKTVVGIHRAVHLAEKVYPAREGHRILLCTFSKKLAGYIRDKVERLARQRGVENNVEVRGVDQLINTQLNRNAVSGGRLDLKLIEEIWEEVYLEIAPEEPLSFFRTEYEEVIQRKGITSREKYLKTNRTGQGAPLPPSRRKKLWPVWEEFMRRKKEAGVIDFEDRAHLLQKACAEGKIEPQYDSIIVDEAQDLSPAKIRALYLQLRTNRNNFMLLSDQNQRIFRLGNYRQETGIEIKGRTYYLTLNYRMSKQIRDFADRQFFSSVPARGHLRGFKSLFQGPEPREFEFETDREQHEFLLKQLKKLREEGVDYHEICLIAPAGRDKLAGILELQEIPYQNLKGEEFPREGEGVALSTLHGVKGLEFRVVFIPYYNFIGYWLEKEEMQGDPYTRDREVQVDCLRYVAATRARDELIISAVKKD